MLTLLAMCLWSASASAPAADSFKVYRGSDGQTVEVVGLAPRTDRKAVVRVRGADSDADGLALPCRISAAGTGFDYVTRREGSDWVVMAQREGRSEVTVPGRGAFAVRFDQPATDAASAAPVLEAWAGQQTSGALTEFARKKWPHLEAKYLKKAAAAQAELRASCGAEVVLRLDFGSFGDDAMADLDVWALCEPLAKVASHRCPALKKAPALSCRMGPALDLVVDSAGTTFVTTRAGATEGPVFLDKRWRP